jgi:small basic protein
MVGGLMEGINTVRTQDYLKLLVAASAWAVLRAVMTALCAKFEKRGIAWFFTASFFGSTLVAAYCLAKLL